MSYITSVKPQIDFWLALMLVIMLSPLFFILSLAGAIAFGNPFFMQTRAGKGGRTFRVVKFTSMLSDASLTESQRMTKYGVWLRRLSLDELPQLFNVLGGSMSLVGPRPLPVSYLPLMNKSQKNRLSLKPGITGLAQVSGRNSLSWDQKFSFDNLYVENASFLFDCRILGRTLPVWAKGEGVTFAGHATMPVFEGNSKQEFSE